MAFLPKALYLTDVEVADKILATKFGNWKPSFSVVHNTGIPNLKQGEAWGESARAAWGANLNHYYKSLGWHSGPHAVGTFFGAVQLCDFAEDGVHCSCWNHLSWGIETFGDFRTGGDDPFTGSGAKAVASTVNILAAMHLRMNWAPGDFQVGVKGLHLHEMCTRDHHACPGNLITRSWLVDQVEKQMTFLHSGWNKPAVSTKPVVPTPIPVDVKPVGSHLDVLPTDGIEIMGWPSESSDPIFFTNMDTFYDTILELSANAAITAGLTAQPEAESAFRVDVVGDNHSAYGVCQWHEDRVEAIKNGCSIDVRTASIKEQAEAVWWELNHLEIKALAELKLCNTANEAGQMACKYYERAGAGNAQQKRGLMAERIATRRAKKSV